jgi:PAS domain S-box-containing protein
VTAEGDRLHGLAASGRPETRAQPADAGPGWQQGAIHDEVVRQSRDAIVLTDPGDVVRLWSPGAERLYGIDAGDAIGRPLHELIATVDDAGRPISRDAARGEAESAGTWRHRVTQRPLVGSLPRQDVIVDSIVTALRGSDGRSTGLLEMNRDVSASARLESELTALGSLVVVTGTARTKAEVARAALEILCRATGAEAGLVTLMEGTYRATAHIGVDQSTIDVIVDYGQLGGPILKALEQPDAFISADVATAPLREDVRAAVLADGIQHLIVVGLRLSGRLTGTMALGWRRADPPAPSRAIVHQAAALVAASLENARLLEAVEDGLREERTLNHRMRALVELTRLPDAVGQETSPLDRLIADVDEVVGSDGTSLVWVVGDGLVLAGTHRIDPAWVLPLLDRPLSNLPIARRLIDGAHSQLIPLDIDHLSAAAATATATQGYRTLVAFAIREGTQLVGILFSVFRRPADELEIDERTLDAIGRVLDISFANRRLREVVSASERRYRELFESTPDALLVQSLDSVILDANPAAHRMYGQGLIGSRVEDIGATPPVAAPTGPASGPDSSVVRSSTGTGRRLDGTTFPEEVELRMIEIDGERRVMAIVRDLTERTKLQAELIQAQKMEAIGQLVAGVAHELNNPLAAIVAFSQLIRTDPGLPTDLRNQADSLIQEANRTRVIVQNLLDFARQRPPERVATELRPLVDSILGLQSYVLNRNHVTVEVDIPADVPSILVDRSQLQQVLINLTVNSAQAIHAAGRPGTIRIEARPSVADDRPTVRISILDDGPGVSSEILNRLFLPFVTTKEPGEGTGLGLSVSFGIIAGHGGTLRYEPSPGGGASFVIELPVGPGTPTPASEPALRPAAAPRRADAPVPRETKAAARMDGGPGADTAPPSEAARPTRVLVLDDEPSIRDFLGRVLVRAGYEPVIAATGAAALAEIRRDPPDAILCDHRMAGMSGTEFHDAVSAISPALGRRFAFMSGDVLNPELHEFAVTRGVQLLAKPFDIAAVASIVAALVAVEPA